MAARSDLPVPYTPGSQPNLAGGEQRYLQLELGRISAAVTSILRLLPQPATSAPKSPTDGMVRLSRAPWRPVSGTTTDAWVFWDAPTSAWLLLHSN